MPGSYTAEFQGEIKNALIDAPFGQRLGLSRNDLHGAVRSAEAAVQAGNLDEAFRNYAYLVMLDPTNAHYHCGLAEVALDTGRFEMALQSASVVVATRPSEPEGYFLSARACIGMAEPALGLDDLAETERWAAKAGKPAYYAAAQRLRVLVDGAPGRASAG